MLTKSTVVKVFAILLFSSIAYGQTIDQFHCVGETPTQCQLPSIDQLDQMISDAQASITTTEHKVDQAALQLETDADQLKAMANSLPNTKYSQVYLAASDEVKNSAD